MLKPRRLQRNKWDKKRQKNQYESNSFEEDVLKGFTGMIYLHARELCTAIKIMVKFLKQFMGDLYFPDVI